MGSAAAKAAKVAMAFVVSPAAGVREAGVALIDALVKSDPAMKVALDGVTAQLTALASARGYSYEQARTAFQSMQDLMAQHRLTPEKLAALDFDPQRATRALLDKSEPVMRGLTQDEVDLTEQAVLALYGAVLSNPKLLPGRDEAFQRRMLNEMDRLALPAQQRAQPLEQLRARGLEAAGDVPLSRTGSPAKAIQARAGSQVFGFVDRGRILEALADWLGDQEPFAMVVIGGRGGSGKTRLGVELCLKAQDSGWLTGMLQTDPPAAALPALAEAQAWRLVVIDYAETRIEQLASLLPLLVAGASRLYPVRVALLVRSRPAGVRDWRASLTVSGDENLGNLLDDADEFEIETTEAQDRQEVYRNAVLGLTARRVDQSGEPFPPPAGDFVVPDLSSPVFDNPLMVVIAAYLAAHHEPATTAPPPRSQPELLEQLLQHEARYWRRQWTQAALSGSDDVLRARVVALATLAGAQDEDEAAGLLPVLPDLATESSGRVRAIARWAHNLYADTGPGWWSPLQPDVLGEHLVATQLGSGRKVIAGVLDREDASRLNQPLDLLARAAPEHPDLRTTVAALLPDRLEALCRSAAQQAAGVRGGWDTASTTTLAGALARTLQVTPITDPEALRRATDNLPSSPNLIVGPLTLALSDQLVTLHRELAAANPAVYRSDLAKSLNNLSIQLATAGRRPEALTVIEEGVAVYRELAAADPAAYQPDLASSLHTLSIRLREAGHRLEALAAIEEAVAIRRGLAAVNSAAYQPDLVRSLSILSSHLGEAGRPEALAISQGIVAVYRALAAANPAAFQPDLALSLNNLSNHLGELGHRTEALAAIEEAVTLRRELAAASPAAHQPGLAKSLNNLSIRRGEAGRRPEALAAIEEAVTLRRELAATNPAAYQPDLASSLHNLSIHLNEAGRRPEALAAIQEAVTLRRKLTAGDRARFTEGLSTSLRRLGRLLREDGDEEGAARADDEASEVSQ